jgi:hypothetical protein
MRPRNGVANRNGSVWSGRKVATTVRSVAAITNGRDFIEQVNRNGASALMGPNVALERPTDAAC